MTPYFLALTAIQPQDQARVGGKALALARLARAGLPVPTAWCLTAAAYREYLAATGIHERILLELHRKDFKDMRWEELWDAALRVRHLFLHTPLPPNLHRALTDFLQRHCPHTPVVVRSSSPEEDSRRASFAGLHESYVNVRGPAAIIEHIIRVWASLWSDAALLYRQELGLDVGRSAMAVLVQELIGGERSGVAFSRHPGDSSLAIIEAVHGLNQGLVDGAVEPDRWLVSRDRGAVVDFSPALRSRQAVPAATGVALETLPATLAASPPLSEEEVLRVAQLALQAESFFDGPQDVEWTMQAGALFVLQSRPITTLSPADPQAADNRPWYLSLRRSLDSLQDLRRRIEQDLLPAMAAAAAELARCDLQSLSDTELAAEISRRTEIHNHWVAVYWQDFIPFAHGMRLFGQTYNDAVRPEDPYEFMDLLAGTPLLSLERNRRLAELAAFVRLRPELADRLEAHDLAALDPEFRSRLEDFQRHFGDLSCPAAGGVGCGPGLGIISRLLRELAGRPESPSRPPAVDVKVRENTFLEHVAAAERPQAARLLELARASYRLRDDDNIHLGRLEAQKLAALNEGRRRLAARGVASVDSWSAQDIDAALREPDYRPAASPLPAPPPPAFTLKPRQLLGQPAGPGLGRGPARVVRGPADLEGFRQGDILVCDALDPNMTFVVPLAAGIVERRGGMLIHGAIIAREYGLPCVTGVPEATLLIQTGDPLTVDGYLGIVTVGARSPDRT